MHEEIDDILARVRQRFFELADKPQYAEPFLAHLRTMSRPILEPTAVPTHSPIRFPKQVHIAFAVCQCGCKEFIVDGSTQECQYCGDLMFRTETAEYSRTDAAGGSD